MSDTDPNGDATSDATTPSTPDGTAPPPTKAPRRRRATKATPEVAADSPTDAGTETEAAPAPKKAPRKRAPRKAAAPPAPELDEDGNPILAELASGEPVVAAVEDASAVTEGAVADAAAPPGTFDTPEPVKRTRTRRAPATVPFQAPPPAEDDDADAAPAPRRRRRAGTAGAVSPSELVPALIEPPPVADDEDEETEDDDSPRTEGDDDADRPRRRRRGRRGRGRRPEGEDGDDDATEEATTEDADGAKAGADDDGDDDDSASGTTRRRRRRRRTGGGGDDNGDDEPGTVVHVREPRQRTSRAKDGGGAADEDGVRGISGSTRMAAKRVRRQEGRDSGRGRKPILSEAEFLARREAVERTMVVRQRGDRTQIAVLEDGVLVEHYVTKTSAQSFAGNVYLGRVQNVLPSMEAAFVDVGKGRNAVLYAGEVNWAALGAGNGARKIEAHLKSGQEVLVQVSKDPIGHKGARLTGQISLPGRYLVYVPEGSMTGISRKLPEKERDRLKAILKKVVPDEAGVIIRTAAEGASEEEIAGDVRRLQAQWEVIQTKAAKGGGPTLLHAEPDLVIRVVRDVFNEDFSSLVVQGDSEWDTIRDYVEFVAPDLAPRVSRHTSEKDVFAEHRIDEQLAKALDRKVWLPSGGSLVIDRTEAMIVVDVNTGKYVGKGGNLEETVTRNNLEAAEEIARQLRLRDLGGIIVVDFIDMVLESNRDLVVRRLVECMARDRTKHQVAEVTSLGLVQMTRKRVGQGLLESFSEPCEKCNGRGVLVSSDPVDVKTGGGDDRGGRDRDRDRGRGRGGKEGVAKDSGAKEAKEGKEGREGKESKDGGGRNGDKPSGRDDNGGGRGSGGGRSSGAGREDAAANGEEQPDGAPRRRRRGGRGAGAATVPPSDEMAELLTSAAPGVDEVAGTAGPAVPEPGEILAADSAPGLVPDLAEQPTPAEEDLPVMPAEIASVMDPEPAEDTVRVEADAESSPAPRRRRRATSRPAGPPS